MLHEDEQALEVARLRASLVRTATYFTRRRQDAEDLVQTTFVRWLQSDKDVTELASHRALLKTILKRLIIDRSRQQKRWRIEASDEHWQRSSHADDQVADWRGVSSLQLEAALSLCSESDRELLRMHYFDGRAYRDIAEALGVPASTVATRLRRARTQLRLQLALSAGCSLLRPHSETSWL